MGKVRFEKQSAGFERFESRLIIRDRDPCKRSSVTPGVHADGEGNCTA